MGVPNDANISLFPQQSPQNNLKPVTCLVVLSLEKNSSFYENVLLPAIRSVLENDPYYWQVVHSHDKNHSDNPQQNISKWMEQAEFYIVDISEQQPDTFIELGRICENQKHKGANVPIIVLEKKLDNESKTDNTSKISLRDEIMRIDYTPFKGEHAIDDLAIEFRKGIEGRQSILKNAQQLNATRQAHYLSRQVLMDVTRMQEKDASILVENYGTMENFVQTQPHKIARLLKISNSTLVDAYLEAIKKLLNEIKNH